MSAWSYGWVEVPHPLAPEAGKLRWDGLLNLEPWFTWGIVSPEPWGDRL